MAIAKPATSDAIPPLYIYDDEANYVYAQSLRDRGISDHVFEDAQRLGYWGELVDTTYYLIPWLDKCSQASMLEDPVEFRAPESGLLFIQFVAPGCVQCARVSDAIRRAIAEHPDVPFRWVEITVPASIGRVIGV